MIARLLVLGVAIVAGALAAYGLLLDRSGASFPIATAGLLVLGIALGLLGLMLGTGGIRAGREGRGCAGTIVAFAGGLCMLAAAGALAGGIILAILAGAG